MTPESHTELLQNPVVRLLLTNTLEEAPALWRRFHEVESFNFYVHERMPAILLAMLIVLLISVGCVMGIVTLLPGMHWSFVLPIIVLLPIVLAGSLLVQVFVFFSWIEGRSLERALGSRRKAVRGAVATWLRQKLKLDLGPFPPVPWPLATIFLFGPLIMLAYSWPPAAMAFVTLAVLTPFLYALFDR